MSATKLEEEVRAEEVLSQRLGEYAGEWVAVRNHKVVAHKETLNALMDEIDANQVEGIFQVPEDKNAPCFF